jgi:hypothetical protein
MWLVQHRGRRIIAAGVQAELHFGAWQDPFGVHPHFLRLAPSDKLITAMICSLSGFVRLERTIGEPS